MKLHVQNTLFGLTPVSDEDYELKRQLALNQIYVIDIKKSRNYEFHKKYFKLINTAWEYQSEKRIEFFKNNVDVFRKSVEVTAGYCDTIWNHNLKSQVDIPKSISFDKMDNIEFQKLYEDVNRVLFTVFLNHISEEEFTKNLIDY